MANDERQLFLINEMNGAIAEAQDLLLGEHSDESMERIPELFQDLSAMVFDLGFVPLSEIFRDLSEIIGQIISDRLVRGESQQIKVAKETAYLATSIAFRQIINEEQCDEEIASLRELAESIRFGDSIGFQVTDKAQLEDSDDRITLFFGNEEPMAEEEAASGIPALKMLVVDDEAPNRLVLQTMLASYGKVDLAFDGQEAVDAFEYNFREGTPYKAIFLDIMMPNMDGHEALRTIRRMENEFGVPPRDEAVIFMVTCLDSPASVCSAFFKEFCTDYINKPITRKKIFDKMQEYGLLPKGVE